jgi:hypothetical protein
LNFSFSLLPLKWFHLWKQQLSLNHKIIFICNHFKCWFQIRWIHEIEILNFIIFLSNSSLCQCRIYQETMKLFSFTLNQSFDFKSDEIIKSIFCFGSRFFKFIILTQRKSYHHPFSKSFRSKIISISLQKSVSYSYRPCQIFQIE